MILICLLSLTSVLWQEDFTEGVGTMSQLYDYKVDIKHKDGKVQLKANPQFEGFAAAWMYIDDTFELSSNEVLELRIKVNDNKVKLRYFYLGQEGRVYLAGEEVLSRSEKWQKLMIPLVCARPFYSSNFPWALTPGKKPPMYLFFENALPGTFEVEIDQVSVSKVVKEGER